MPFKSDKQRRFFGACKGGNATKPCPSKDVVAEFFKADKMDRMSHHGREAKRGRPREGG